MKIIMINDEKMKMKSKWKANEEMKINNVCNEEIMKNIVNESENDNMIWKKAKISR